MVCYYGNIEESNARYFWLTPLSESIFEISSYNLRTSFPLYGGLPMIATSTLSLNAEMLKTVIMLEKDSPGANSIPLQSFLMGNDKRINYSDQYPIPGLYSAPMMPSLSKS